MAVKQDIVTKVVSRSGDGSPLGRIKLAGYIRGSVGLPVNPMRTLGDYALVYLLEGRGWYSDANSLHKEVVAGDALLLFPDLAHTYGPREGETWTEFYVVFNGPVFEVWDRSGALKRDRPIIHLEPIESWLKRMEESVGGHQGPRSDAAMLGVCRLQQTLAEIICGGSIGDAPERTWLHQAQVLLEQELSSKANLEDIATEMGLSYDGFRKKFRRVAGLSPGRYRSLRVIERTCEMLQSTDLTVEQVASNLGFCDQFYFSRRFKQITGYPPAEFRARFPRVSPTPSSVTKSYK